MGAKRGKRAWTVAGAARTARDARIVTARFLRDAPIAREWQATKMMHAFTVHTAHLRQKAPEGVAKANAAALLLTGMGYPPTWRPAHWAEAADTVLADEARHLAEAELYVLSPQMCDVVIAAAQTLTIDDLALITSEDLPSPTGLVMLPQPLLVRAVNGNLGDDRAYHWHTPTVMPVPDLASNGWTPKPAVRFSLYHDSHGPIRPDSFTDFAHQAHAAGTPLPPLLLDAIRCLPFEAVITDEDRANLAQFADTAQRVGDQTRNRTRELGFNEDRVVGEYTPGSEIPDPDDSFTLRFLYAFWRLCEQRIATTSNAEVRHAAQLAADRAGVSPVVRVVQLRATTPDTTPGDHNSDRWHHRWVVRMHKVRQWYPSEQRHKVIYRGPYIKGPDDKPLLGGETVRGLTR